MEDQEDFGLDLNADVSKMDISGLTDYKKGLLRIKDIFDGLPAIPEEFVDFYNRLSEAVIRINDRINKFGTDTKNAYHEALY